MTPVDQGFLFLLAGGLGLALSVTVRAKKYFDLASALNIWISLPGVFVLVYLTRGVLAEDGGIVLFSLATVLILIGLLVVATRGVSNEIRGSVILNGSIVNAVNLPFPLLQFLMGSYSYAATFAATGSALQIISARVMQGRLGTGRTRSGRESFVRLAPLLALGAGVVLHYTVWPQAPAQSLVDDVSLVETGLIAFICFHFGMTLGRSLTSPSLHSPLRSRPFMTTAVFRILVGPALALSIGIPLGIGSLAYLQMVLEAAMPPAILNTVIAASYGFDADFAARSTIVLTPICAVEAVGLFYGLHGL